MELIPVSNLFYMLLPILFVWYYYSKWTDNSSEILYSTFRMVVQLILIGYALIFIFENDSWYFGFLILSIMVIMSSVIAQRNISTKSRKSFFIIFISILVGGTINLVLVIEFVLELTNFYEPRYVIPIAGMIYANCMNAVSLAAERFEKELENKSANEAKRVALKSSMIPKVNTFLAVGIVSLPGMMTGQILSGVDPLIAVRYQIVVMAMVMGSAGISVICYLKLNELKFNQIK